MLCSVLPSARRGPISGHFRWRAADTGPSTVSSQRSTASQPCLLLSLQGKASHRALTTLLRGAVAARASTLGRETVGRFVVATLFGFVDDGSTGVELER